MQTQDNELSMGDAALRRGISAARAGLRSVAAAQFERAAEATPDDANVWLWLAWVGNSPDNTIRCLERVLELSPGHPTALAGLSWARALGHDTPIIPVAIPVAMPVLNRVELDEQTGTDRASTIHKSLAAITGLVNEFDEVDDAPQRLADVSPVVMVEPKPDLSVDDFEAFNPEAPIEPLAEVTLDRPEVLSAGALNRRRWNDLVERDVETPTDSSAWPSLVPPPLPSVLPPPLPNAIAEAPVEPKPVAPIGLSETCDLKSAAPSISVAEVSDVGAAQETAADVDALATSFRPTAEVAPPADGRKLVMVVDDSPTVRKLVSLTLERRGYRVISAFDGVAAIKELGTCRPDLILLDINMPRLDGYRLCKLIKKHEATQTIPVVMLSGKDGMFDKLRGRLVGCSDYITKPFEADSLTQKVAKYLNPASSSL